MTFAERLAFVDTATTLPDNMLVKVDRASMHVALEVRVPLLDHRVVEWVWRHPFDLRIRDGRGKWILRQVLNKYVPAPLTDRPKMGFDPPLGAWLRGPLRAWANERLADVATGSPPLLDRQPIERAWREHLSGRRDRTYELWAVIVFQAWLAAQSSLPSQP
jgi:asparagine synthase (glutamine-hydrolysing)